MEFSKTREVIIASTKQKDGGILRCIDIETGSAYLDASLSPLKPANLLLLLLVLSSAGPGTRSVMHLSGLPEVKSFPAEPISPLVSYADGTYIIGGGSSGNIFLWEVSSGRLLKKWTAHYRGVTCLVLSDDESRLISGAEDGCVHVWSLCTIFDDDATKAATHSYLHTLRVTDIVTGHGGCNAIIISSSEDRTCKVWSLSKGKLLRTIDFPSVINAVALDPCEHIFYAGGNDGRIYVPVNCLAFSKSGVLLVSGWEDGTIRIWNTQSKQIVRTIKSKGPVTNVIVVHRPDDLTSQISAFKRNASLLPPSLDKYVTSTDENDDFKTVTASQPPLSRVTDALYCSTDQEDSTAASHLELDRLRVRCKQLENMHKDLRQSCADEILAKWGC
ncbi:hypothetical protein MKW94_020119 [Papaver nudicaule]|uniref:Uncharacterized protein n=1 Tax=Papaver nudicaule TaxID=74823 RepID=A0AA41W2M8_PAPNU|nr:hypothetical protein [Papaver nudicaule]